MCRFLDVKHLVNWFVKKTHLFTFSKPQIFHKGSCSAGVAQFATCHRESSNSNLRVESHTHDYRRVSVTCRSWM